MTKPARVSCSSRVSIPAVSLLLLFGVAAASACSSGHDDSKPAASRPAADAGTSTAALDRGTDQSLSTVRQLGSEHPTLSHVAFEAPSGLRLHGGQFIPRLVD